MTLRATCSQIFIGVGPANVHRRTRVSHRYRAVRFSELPGRVNRWPGDSVCARSHLAYFLNQQGGLFPEETFLAEAMLFLGGSMCITAFPMLARILHFKGLTGTLMGTVAIGAGTIKASRLRGLLFSLDGARIRQRFD